MKKFLKRPWLWITSTAAVLLLTAAASNDFAVGRNMEILFNIFSKINLLYVDNVDPAKLVEYAAEGMSSHLDPYTEYMPEEDMEDFEIMTTGKYGGIGSLIRQAGDYVVISQPYKGFPADRAGLQAGDKIVEIDGKDAKGMSTSDVSSRLKGDPGTSVKLKIEKFYTGQIAALTIKRERIAISGVPYYGVVGDNIGYIRQDDFTEDCANDVRKAFENLRSKGELKGLILDLRGNGGGILQQAVKIVSLFVPKGTEVVAMRGKVKQLDQVFYTETEPVDTQLPVVVLVNSGSASASEIVCGSIQDLDRGVLLGQRTFGKGLVQTTYPVGYNSWLKVTTAKYYIPSGRCIQAIDYAHRNADGGVSFVADSLMKEFSTKAGRKVYDGGGIVPEVTTQVQYHSRFATIVYTRGYINDFADQYLKANPGLQVSLLGYHLDDKGYESFVKFMADKPVEYRSETASLLEQLKKSAEQERHMDKIEELIARIEEQLPENKDENLALYRTELAELIEDEIVMRQHYIQGVIERSLTTDSDVTQAAALLKDNARYRELLTPKK